ncbi:hypothetical protein vBBceHLY2_00134 [Bacillus phage vB_BceH_LY2]|nr:hypothetical protein vBBceHLY2_00134 [Bacillus phage vB_BceH_LY2]
MLSILKRLTALYNLLVYNKTNTIDNKIVRVQVSVRAYNIAIDKVINNNTKLLRGD